MLISQPRCSYKPCSNKKRVEAILKETVIYINIFPVKKHFLQMCVRKKTSKETKILQKFRNCKNWPTCNLYTQFGTFFKKNTNCLLLSSPNLIKQENELYAYNPHHFYKRQIKNSHITISSKITISPSDVLPRNYRLILAVIKKKKERKLFFLRQFECWFSCLTIYVHAD